MIMGEIEKWLEEFRIGWQEGDVEKVMSLFTEDVEYHETPFLQLKGSDLRSEWGGVRDQEDISLDFGVFSKAGSSYTVQWALEYNESGERNIVKGVYLIKLNSENKCYEFWQYCEDV